MILIIVEGYLASGKSTFAARLSKDTGVPCLIKDEFKNALCAGIKLSSREESSLFSAVTFNAMMYAAERIMEAGFPLIIEGNFVPAGIKKVDEEGIIAGLISKYGYRPLTYMFHGDTHVLHERFTAREKQPGRGANRMFGDMPYEDFDRACRNLDAFSVGGEIVRVDTTDFGSVDFRGLINMAETMIKTAGCGNANEQL